MEEVILNLNSCPKFSSTLGDDSGDMMMIFIRGALTIVDNGDDEGGGDDDDGDDDGVGDDDGGGDDDGDLPQLVLWQL